MFPRSAAKGQKVNSRKADEVFTEDATQASPERQKEDMAEHPRA